MSAGNNGPLVLPVPFFNVINGGSHAGNGLAMQEFMIAPVGAASFQQAMQMGSEVYHHLKKVIQAQYGQDAVNVGDEGGFAPNISSSEEGLQLISRAIAAAGYTGKVMMAMDVAASEFYTEDKKYDLGFKVQPNDGSKCLSADQLSSVYKGFVSSHPMVSIEDPFDQDDWSSWSGITSQLGKDVQVRPAASLAVLCLTSNKDRRRRSAGHQPEPHR